MELDWPAFKVQVHTVLGEYFSSHMVRAKAYSPAFGAMWEQMADATLGGKWMRPKLVYLAYGAFGGGNWRAGAELAAAHANLALWKNQSPTLQCCQKFPTRQPPPC